MQCRYISPLSQALVAILPWFSAVCLMQSAEVCGRASYCCNCLTDCSMVVISKGISHRCLSCLLGTYHLCLNLVIGHMHIHLGVNSCLGCKGHSLFCWLWLQLTCAIDRTRLNRAQQSKIWRLSAHSCHIHVGMAANAALKDKDFKHKLMSGNALA